MRRVLFSTLIIVFLFSTVLFADTTIRLTNGDWEPYMGENCAYYGLASHIVSEAFKLENIKVIWGFFPWKRSLVLAKRGDEWDASCCWWPGEEVGSNFYMSEGVCKSSAVFFHLRDYTFEWESIDDLKELKIGGTFEYEYSKEFMDAMKEKRISVDMAPSDELNFRKLLGGRIHIFPNDPIVGYSQIRNSFPAVEVQRFTHHPRELQATTLNLIISKQYPGGRQLLDRFHSGLKKLKDSGRYDQMLQDVMVGKYDKHTIQ